MHLAVVSLFFALLASPSLAGTMNKDGYFNAEVRAFSSHLPLVHINTNGRAIPQEGKIPAKVSFLDQGENRSTDLLRLPAAFQAEIEVRGNSSAKWAKKQYDLEFHAAGDSSKGLKVPFLGLPAHHKWVIAAPYSDRSLIRNSFAFALSRSLADSRGESWWAPRTRAFELFLNGEYYGVYVLTEKIGSDSERLDLGKTNWAAPGSSPFLVKVERVRKADPDSFVETAYGTKVNFKEPKAGDFAKKARKNPEEARQLKRHIARTMHRFESAVKAIKKGDLQTYRKLVDITSVQNFILMHEIFRNIDGFRRSIYVHYKNGKLHLGPVWDFDLAWANLRAFTQMRSKGWQVGHSFYIDFNHELFWFRTMLRDPKFQRGLAARYLTLRKAGGPLSTGAIMRQIDRMAAEYKGGPWERNFTVWGVNGTDGDGLVMRLTPRFKSFHYPSHVAWLKKWLLERLEWMDDHVYEFGGDEAPETTADNLVLRPDLANSQLP